MSEPEIDKEVLDLVKLAYPDLIQPSLKELGFGLATIIEFLGLPLYRLKLFNVRTKQRYGQRIKSLVESLDNVPVQDRAELPTSIGCPAIEQLLIESDEDISDLYINLLTKASTKSRGGDAHPSFINALKNMSNDEAKLIGYLYGKLEIPYITFQLQFNEKESLDMTAILTGIEYRIILQYPKNIPLYFENLTGLGILSKEMGSLSDTNKWYKPLLELYEPLRKSLHEKGHSDGKRYPIAAICARFRVTSYGRLFIEACLKKYSPGT